MDLTPVPVGGDILVATSPFPQEYSSITAFADGNNIQPVGKEKLGQARGRSLGEGSQGLRVEEE